MQLLGEGRVYGGGLHKLETKGTGQRGGGGDRGVAANIGVTARAETGETIRNGGLLRSTRTMTHESETNPFALYTPIVAVHRDSQLTAMLGIAGWPDGFTSLV